MYEDSATKFPNRSEPLSEIHEGDNLSTKSKMPINAIVLPNAVKKHADELLKNMVLEGVHADSANIKKGNSGNSGISLNFKEILKQVNHVFGFNIMC